MKEQHGYALWHIEEASRLMKRGSRVRDVVGQLVKALTWILPGAAVTWPPDAEAIFFEDEAL